MAGIEHLEVHSKSYIVRWVQVDEGHTLSWSVQPHKKSINFGIVKHPGSGATTLTASQGDHEIADQTHGTSDAKTSRFSKKEGTAQELLSSKGFILIKWAGNCEADKVSIGTHDVQVGQAGMYGLVFDNTFSKQTSKTATFVILTYPTDAPPQTNSHVPNLQLPAARVSQSSLGKHGSPNPNKGEAFASPSSDSLQSHGPTGRTLSVSSHNEGMNTSQYHVGTLSKRRRKKGQGYARRFFSLDYSTCTLSYYYNRNSSALRGAIPLSLAAVAADQRRREISIDSGAEIWHLRAPNDKEFQDWARALEKASRVARGLEAIPRPAREGRKVDPRLLKLPHQQHMNHDEDAEWRQVETLVSRVVGTRDALRRLTRDVENHQPLPSGGSNFLSPSSAHSTGDERGDSYFPQTTDKRHFWKRKSSAPLLGPSALATTTATALAAPSPSSASASAPKSPDEIRISKRSSKGQAHEEKGLHGHCEALLADLDSVVAEFTTLINTSKQRRLVTPLATAASARRSMDTVSTTDEFFDAEDSASKVVKIDGSDGESHKSDDDEHSMKDTSSVSSIDDEDKLGADGAGHLYPARPKALTPLPIQTAVARRITVPPTNITPPSAIAVFRKNVGKDLSTISMPVTTNEPLSMTQKVAEQLEYAQILDHAIQQKTPQERLAFVTAFAVSQFSNSRAKERALRKPFTPLLGETYELVRTEQEVPGGFRCLVEKIQHRPLKLAIHADSANWSLSQTVAPGQKFWGRSAEITTDGRVRVALRLPDGSDELYSWSIATMFLRNMVVGEKYVEPVGTMHVTNDTTGHKASVEFKVKGMFGGRVEEVQVDVHDSAGDPVGPNLTGNWTTALQVAGKKGQEIWRVGDLVENAASTYGWTKFAASLNEVTELEKGRLAPTDSRLRPDQRLAEEGDYDEAEAWKIKLEEAQRQRRKTTEEAGETHKPKWFVQADDAPNGEEVWKMKTGKDGYWEERVKGEWKGVVQIFDV